VAVGSDIIRIIGGRRLEGTVAVSGSKNGVLPMLAATLLADGESVLQGVPAIADVDTMSDLLRAFGLAVSREGLTVTVSGRPQHAVAPLDLVHRMRASFYVSGPLLARLGRAEVPLPGGCALGSRPVDYVVRGFESLGARATVEHGYVCLAAPKLSGATVYLDARYRSPGATFNLTMAAVLAEGTTVIENACAEPEVVRFCEFLKAMGARIEGAGASQLRIEGVSALHGAEARVPPDRLEAGTFLLAGAVTGGDVTVQPIPPSDLAFFLDKLAEAGLEIRREPESIRLIAPGRPRAIDVVTGPFPLFPTDLQPPTMSLMCIAEGTSLMQETIYDGRLTHADELRRMGAQIRLVDQSAVVTGVDRLTGAAVSAQNIRAGAAMVLAGLAADGETEITGRRLIARGYENLEVKLAALGADIRDGEPA
jgi:UDP-N-acetylglucosamine 1-carboxyvinyltransferase